MALYKYGHYLTQSNHEAFDKTYEPGTQAVYPGIYKCTSCGDEIGIAGGHTLPPQNHRQHLPSLGPIRWKLLVGPQTNK